MKQVDTKKLVLGCLVIMMFMIAYTKVKTTIATKKTETEIEVVVNNGNGTNSLLLTDRLNNTETVAATGDSEKQSQDDEDILGPAEKMDLLKAKKDSYGVIVELDHVSAGRISLHGTFGYMVFSLASSENGEIAATLENAVTLEELGGITMGGAARTDILAGDGCALIVPGIHNQEIARRRKFLYIEETNEITGGVVAPDWMMEKMSVNDYSDAVVEEEYVSELTAILKEDGNRKLLYGPVAIPESNSNIYAFLSENGDKLENLWYGLWNRDTGTVTKVPLFD